MTTAAEERAKVVKYLRDCGMDYDRSMKSEGDPCDRRVYDQLSTNCFMLASAIERGEHWEEEKEGGHE